MAEGAPLLREYTLRAYRGFESLLHRQIASFLGGFFVSNRIWRVRALAGSSRAQSARQRQHEVMATRSAKATPE